MARIVKLQYDMVTAMGREHYVPPSYPTADKRILKGRKKMVDYARKAAMNNPLYQRLINLVADYILGADGVEIIIDRPGTTDQEREEISARWRKWCADCDARGEESFSNLEREIVREVLNVGEVLIVINRDKTLSIVQTEHIERIVTDDRGRARAYVCTYKDAEGKPVEMTYRADDCVFLYNKTEPSATRGVGFFWSAFIYLFYVDNILKAASKSAAEASKWVAVLTSAASQANYVAPGAVNPENPIRGQLQDTDSGMYFSMAPGEDARILNNPKPESQLEAGLRPFFKIICCAVGIPVDLALADYSNQSYSSSKSLSLHLQATMAALGNDLIHKFYRRVFYKCVSTADVNFVLPRMQTVDEYKEAQADAVRIANGLATQTQILKERNIDFTELQQARADELKATWDMAQQVSEATGGKIPASAIFAKMTGINGGNTNAV